jgi:hypothetical protein
VSKYVRISIYKQIKEKAKKRQLIIESLKVKVAEQDKRIAELEEEKLNMQISLTGVRESIGRISAFIENIEPRSHEAVIIFNQCMEICTAIDEIDLPEFEFKGGEK